MDIRRKIEVFGDSILKGIQVNPLNRRYHVNNNIDIEMLSKKFSLDVINHSLLGCTVTKGKALLERFLSKAPTATAIIMDYGGNDCDFDWKAVSEDPTAEHEPKTPINKFVAIYTEMVEKISKCGIRPVLTNLPPLEPQRYFDWFAKELNKDALLKWLDGVNTIYRFQEMYSRTVEDIAKTTGALLVDLRGTFLKERHIKRFLCEDGIHPNTEGQKLITQAFSKFCVKALA